MKRMVELALASGLALLIAGCASQGGGSSTGSTGTSAEAAAAPAVSVPAAARNFNLAVKCPGVHYEKTHGWTNQQIMQQEALDESDIPACEAWAQAQPKGYVPPPPPGVAPAPGAKSTSAATSGAAAKPANP